MTQRQGQAFIGLKVSPQLYKAVEEASKGRDKSQFVREAIAEKLGIDVGHSTVIAPSRTGKGGPSVKYRRTQRQSQFQKKKI